MKRSRESPLLGTNHLFAMRAQFQLGSLKVITLVWLHRLDYQMNGCHQLILPRPPQALAYLELFQLIIQAWWEG